MAYTVMALSRQAACMQDEVHNDTKDVHNDMRDDSARQYCVTTCNRMYIDMRDDDVCTTACVTT